MIAWSAKTTTEILADVSAMLTEVIADLPPDCMWMPCTTGRWNVFQRPVVRKLIITRKRRRPAFASAWRRLG